jgi:protein transport protein SEC24
VIVTASKIPSLGIGVIKQPRPVQKLYGTDNEKELYKPIDGFWPQTAIECAKNQISFDLMMFPTDYCELMTLGQICHLTNGLQSCFINYSSAQDQMRLKAALERSLLQTAGYGALLRVRCSPGLRIKQYHGHYLSQDPHDMDLASIHSSSTFYAELTHEAKLDAKGYAYVQCAMLFTTRDGHRRVRVHTLKLSVCSTYAVLFRNSDLEACTIAITHKAIHDAVNKGSKYARDQSNQRLIDLLVAYRKYCSSGSHSGQLLLPEQLKLLPLYNLCLTKSDALVGGTDVRFDERVQSIFDLLTMPTHRVLFYLYPRLYSLRNILSTGHVGLPNPANGEIYLPPVCQLTTDIIMTHGLYALHDQQANTVYLWIGSQISPNVCAQLFGTEDPMLIGLAECPFDQWNERLRNVLISMMKGCGGDHGLDRLVILHERKDPAEEAFFRNMLEDEAVPGGQSYSDLLCAYHKSINARLM